MSKRINKNKFIYWVAIAFAISIASCGRVDTPPAAVVTPHASDTVALAASDGDPADATLPSLVERRHFAIYSTYRVLFDDSPDVFQSRAGGDGLQPAVTSDDPGGFPGCSIRALLTLD